MRTHFTETRKGRAARLRRDAGQVDPRRVRPPHLLNTRRYRLEGGQMKQLRAPAVWVCRPSFGCEGVGRPHIAFWNEPDESDVDDGTRRP
jgi:hypothetical protein